jgi:hypothetical protein
MAPPAVSAPTMSLPPGYVPQLVPYDSAFVGAPIAIDAPAVAAPPDGAATQPSPTLAPQQPPLGAPQPAESAIAAPPADSAAVPPPRPRRRRGLRNLMLFAVGMALLGGTLLVVLNLRPPPEPSPAAPTPAEQPPVRAL